MEKYNKQDIFPSIFQLPLIWRPGAENKLLEIKWIPISIVWAFCISIVSIRIIEHINVYFVYETLLN